MLKFAPWKVIVLSTLLGANIFFALSVKRVYFSSRELSIPQLPWQGLTSSRDNISPEARPLAAYAQTLSHPIFFESRNPFVPPPPPPPPPPTIDLPPETKEPPMVIDPGLVLGGILMLEGTQKAYLFTENIADGVWVATGYEMLGWTVLSIDNDRVSLGSGNKVISLKIYRDQ